jgi:hypothetical protein
MADGDHSTSNGDHSTSNGDGTEERPAQHRADRAWVGGGVVAVVLFLVLKGINHVAVAAGAWNLPWYLTAGIVAGGVTCYLLGEAFLRRGYRR